MSTEALAGADTRWPAGVDRIVLDETDSTMAEAARRAPGLSRPAWILARRQTAGRGRRGRPWLAPEGHFAATLVLRPAEAPAHAALRSFVAALALADTFDSATGRPEAVALKWPNDVLLNGGKAAGILLESAGQGARLDYLGIGFGVNLDAAPDAAAVEAGAARPVSLAAETGVRLDPEAFLDLLASAWAAREAVFAAEGFAPIRAAWLARSARLGRTVAARTPRETLTGTFETVDETGALILATASGRRAIPAAEVFF